MVKQEAESGDEIVRQINAGLAVREIDFSVQACTKIPTKKLESGKALALREQIVTEIFQQAGITQNEAPRVWEKVAEGIMLRKMLKITELEQHERWKTVLAHVGTAIGILRVTNSHVSLAPDDLGFIIAALLFRRLQPSGSNRRGQVKNFIELFGTRNAMQWLPVALVVFKSYPKLRRPFIIEVDEGARTPKFRYEQTLSDHPTLIVTTRAPKVNIYEDDMIEAVRVMERRLSDFEVLPKEPDITDHNEDSIDSGRGTTQAELTAPAPSPAANHPEPQPRRELFESYKLLWKDSLREHGSVSGSLRGLVYQDCTDEQIFYLEETEKDFLAERMG